jgi:7-cyano-7-deazaguanine synthase
MRDAAREAARDLHEGQVPSREFVVVLCSGGIDSTTLAASVHQQRGGVELVFVDYGQSAHASEMASVEAVAAWLGVPWQQIRVHGLAEPKGGEIVGRNLLLVSLALSARPQATTIGLGVHGGTGYRDCSPAFAELAQGLLDFHTDGRCRLAAPFLALSKPDVVALARELGVPLEQTYSCEHGDVACGRCRSCQDREALDVA